MRMKQPFELTRQLRFGANILTATHSDDYETMQALLYRDRADERLKLKPYGGACIQDVSIFAAWVAHSLRETVTFDFTGFRKTKIEVDPTADLGGVELGSPEADAIIDDFDQHVERAAGVPAEAKLAIGLLARQAYESYQLQLEQAS